MQISPTIAYFAYYNPPNNLSQLEKKRIPLTVQKSEIDSVRLVLVMLKTTNQWLTSVWTWMNAFFDDVQVFRQRDLAATFLLH